MGLIIEDQNLRNPEDVAIDLFQLSVEPGEREEPPRLFFLKLAVLSMIVLVLKVGSYQRVPAALDLLFVFVTSIVVSLCCLGCIALLQRVTRHGMHGLVMLFTTSIMLFIAIEWFI